MMNKPILKDSFSVDDIHKLRKYHYEKNKNISGKEWIVEINNKAEKFKEEMRKEKEQKIAM